MGYSIFSKRSVRHELQRRWNKTRISPFIWKLKFNHESTLVVVQYERILGPLKSRYVSVPGSGKEGYYMRYMIKIWRIRNNPMNWIEIRKQKISQSERMSVTCLSTIVFHKKTLPQNETDFLVYNIDQGTFGCEKFMEYSYWEINWYIKFLKEWWAVIYKI